MNHPPLPPNCRFKVYERVCDTFDFKTDFGFVSSDSADGRFVAACVFNRLWLDEEKRLNRLYTSVYNLPENSSEIKDAEIIARGNAAAWQEWGNQK